jgi:predicted negative regulator of RcsB-dependent stress response
MAVYDLEEQEKLDDLKAWWDHYGRYVSAGLVALALVMVAVQGWRWYAQKLASEASVLYLAASTGVRNSDAAKVKDAALELESKYARTGYAPRAALLYAKTAFDGGDKAASKSQLQWVIDSNAEDELKTIARFRLAEALLEDKQFDDALKTLDAKHAESFDGIYLDLKGDILAAAGKAADARTAYQAALAKIDAKSPYRNLVQVKLDSVGGAQ